MKDDGRKLFSEGKIGTLRLKNRVIMAPLSTNFPSVSGEITPEFTAFYRERALGGVGMIIVEWANVDYPLGKSGYTQMRLDDDAFIPSLGQFVEIIHESGAKVCLQLNHAGGMFGDRGRSELSPISASALVYGKNNRLAKEASIEEIKTIINKFILAAERAQMAGFDAIEIHGATSYLISNFLSAWTNHRNDMYGGNTENRARIAVEIVEGIRQKCGSQFPILFRISGDEFHPEGRKIEETIEIVNMLKKAGIDCVHVTAGTGRDPKSLSRRAHIGPTGYSQGWKSYLARIIKEKCNITTIAVDSIRDVEIAERIVNEDADFVAMARQLIADPDWVNKAMQGGNIRKCLSCNACIQHRSTFGSKLRCCVNPMAGKEYRLVRPQDKIAQEAKCVAVIGGGPAGMEAAVVAATRGHKVTLIEKEEFLGGELIAASGADVKYKFRWLIEWLSEEIKKLPIKVQLGREVEARELIQSDFDVIIVATGSNARMFSPIKEFYEENGESANIILANDYLSGRAKVAPDVEKCLVLGAGNIGQEVAYMVAKGGVKDVKLLEGYRTRDQLLQGDINNATELMDEVIKYGVEIWDHVQIMSVTKNQLIVKVYEEEKALPYDLLIISQGLIPNDSLLKALQSCGKEVIPIGNVNRDRTAFYAMHEGFNAGYFL